MPRPDPIEIVAIAVPVLLEAVVTIFAISVATLITGILCHAI